jgi:hypothetical protein
MEKPGYVKKSFYDYHDIIKYVEEKYNFQSRDYAKKFPYFYAWAQAKGYTNRKLDPAGKNLGSSQIWMSEFRADPEGEAKQPPYEDFWHFVLHKDEEIKRDGFTTMYVKEWIEDIETPEFARTICTYLQKEFGDEIYCQTAW